MSMLSITAPPQLYVAFQNAPSHLQMTHFTSRRTSNPEVPHCFQKYSSILLKHSTSRGALQLISRKAPFSEILRLAILGMQKSLILKQNKTKKSISRGILISLSNVPLLYLQKLPPPENAFRVVSRDILALEPFHFLSGNMKAKPLALAHMLKELRPFPPRSPEKKLYRLPFPSLWFLEVPGDFTVMCWALFPRSRDEVKS